MTLPTPKSGKIQFSVPDAGKECFTAYTIYGELSANTTPLIYLHGGPGVPDFSMKESIGALASKGIPMVFYDQIGCGESTHLPEKKGDGNFWTLELFVKDLENVIAALDVDQYDLFGHSWGGMLAAYHATAHPKALRRLIIANSPARLQDRIDSHARLREILPQDLRETLSIHQANGATNAQGYREATQQFLGRHMCRVKPLPVSLQKSFAALAEDNTVYATMRGPDILKVTGTLKDFDITGDLHLIDVPTLVIDGKYEDVQEGPRIMDAFSKNIKNVKSKTFENSSHMPHLEEPEEFLMVIEDFLLAK